MDQRNKVFFLSLGCPKNTVDSENMMFSLEKAGYELCEEAGSADIIVINTCAFILDAKTESVDAILTAAEIKKENPEVKIVVTGCLAQGYAEELVKELPEVDLFLGTVDMFTLAEKLKALNEEAKEKIFTENINAPLPEGGRAENGLPYAYIKLSEGCNKRCTYCVIPSLRGVQRDRAIEDIVAEAAALVKKGKREIILIAEDTGEYGRERYKKRMLPALLEKLDKIEGVKWIRLLYVYPETVGKELIEAIASSAHVLHYIDIPLQHISDTILKKMGRTTDSAKIKAVIASLRDAMPDITIRSSFIAGFPGESRSDMHELADFLTEIKLTRVGVFAYSREEGTPAYDMPDQVEEGEKLYRRDYLMQVQADVSSIVMEGFIGRKLELVIEEAEGEEEGKNIYSARSYADSPEIDGAVYVYTESVLSAGDYIIAEITDHMEYDLFAEY